MYIELDHGLVPGRIEDIKIVKDLETGKNKKDLESYGHGKFNMRKTIKNVKKYEIKKGQIQDLIQVIKEEHKTTLEEANEEKEETEDLIMEKDDTRILNNTGFKTMDGDMEPIVWSSSGELFYDHDWGFFAAVLACYNNHWVLKTSPDDWWNIIARNVAQNIEENGDKNPVKDFFVEKNEKETIEIRLPGKLDQVDYTWLFEQFSAQIKKAIKKPDYVDKMLANFSTTTPDQLISTQIMLMSSMQKYFNYTMLTSCGIPGVEMIGSLEDWLKLVDKTKNLQKMLEPIMSEIGLKKWFATTLNMLSKLVETFKGEPDKEWWGHILSWNILHGSGGRHWWDGWLIDFLGNGVSEFPKDFQSGIVSVPLNICDKYFGPPVEDTGELVAGTIGYTVEKGDRAPVVQANQGWVLLLPKGSPVIKRMRGEDLY